ncbi:MAG: hypothetical protein ACO3V4_00615 [Ilumatobacteraceae bacterium]
MDVLRESTRRNLDALIARDQSLIACPYPTFADVREIGGVVYSEPLGAWVVTRYDDVRAILRDTERFSSLSPTGPQAAGASLMAGIAELSQDPTMAVVLGSV